MSRCQYKLNETESKVELVFSGLMDETFPSLVDKISPMKDLIVNLAEIKSINSLGIREWMALMDKIPNEKIYFVNCPKVFVDQMNSVQGFLPPRANVLSFYVPYINEDTETEKSLLYSIGKDYAHDYNKIPDSVPDPEGGEFVIDVVETKYFKFLKQIKPLE